MAFFDDFDKKISMISQGAVKKTKEVAETAKLTGAIREEQIKRDECFKQLGMMYFEMYGNNPDQELEKVCYIISEATRKIDMLNEEKRSFKSMDRCKNCGAQVPQNSMFCNSCGSRIMRGGLNEIYRSKGINCLKCGMELNTDSIFCINCGTRVENRHFPQAKEVEKKFCIECGNLLEAEVVFCTQCGTRVNEREFEREDEFKNAEKVISNETADEEDATVVLLSRDQSEVEEVIEEKKTESVLEDENICVQCGMRIKEGAIFCINCGTCVGTKKQMQTIDIEVKNFVRRFCTECGSFISEGQLFCIQCGKRV